MPHHSCPNEAGINISWEIIKQKCDALVLYCSNNATRFHAEDNEGLTVFSRAGGPSALLSQLVKPVVGLWRELAEVTLSN